MLCTYRIGGKELTTFADTSASTVQDIMLRISNLVPGGMKLSLSNFTYTPVPGPALSRDAALSLVAARQSAPYTTVAPGWNCNPDDGRWAAGFEPLQQNAALTCTPTGTRLTTSSGYGVWLYFDNSRFGELPEAFDYSFQATFEGSAHQCVAVMTYANITAGKNYVYAFILCSDGTWSIKYLGYYPDHFQVFLTDHVRSGRINIKGSVAVFAEFRSTTLTFHVDDQVVTTLAASGLMPSILLTNDQGSVLYSNFSYVPRT